jgi:murein DD-endopeptidase MepM/ murein hydrolase activator NlpD
MEFQWHPSSARKPVRSIAPGNRGERMIVLGAGVAALLLTSLPLTVPVVLERRNNEARYAESRIVLDRRRESLASAFAGFDELERRTFMIRDQVFKISVLYEIPASQFPHVIDPQRPAIQKTGSPEEMTNALERQIMALERARALLLNTESAHGDWPSETPALCPLTPGSFVPVRWFGSGRSPWTGETEFSTGIELAAPEGSRVMAAADGIVRFAGKLPARMGERYWRYGNIVSIRHGSRATTVYGYLKSFDVRRGQKIRRGQTLGYVGSSGWALSPRLRYEVWFWKGDRIVPLDPVVAILDYRFRDETARLAEARRVIPESRYASLPRELR